MTSLRNKKLKVKLQEDDRKCQENVSGRPMKSQNNVDKRSQEKKNMNIWPVKPEINKDVTWLLKPAVPHEYRRLCKDQTCQYTRCYKKHSDPKKSWTMQYKVKSNQSVTQEDAILEVTSEKLSPRSQKSQVYTKFKNQTNVRDTKTQT